MPFIEIFPKKIEDKKSLPSFLWLLVPEALIVLAFIMIVVSVLAAVMSGPEQGELILSATAIPSIAIAAIAPIVIGFGGFTFSVRYSTKQWEAPRLSFHM